MIRSKKLGLVAGAATGLIVGGVAFPLAANARLTECEPGYVNTTFSESATDFVPVGTVSATNTQDTAQDMSLAVTNETSHSASITGSVSLESVLVPVKAELAATATASSSWTAGATFPVTVAPHATAVVTYGFATVTFSGSQTTCLSDGQFGAPTSFSGEAPTATHFIS